MRRFIHAIAIAGTLIPAVASGQTAGGNSTPNAGQSPATGSGAATTPSGQSGHSGPSDQSAPAAAQPQQSAPQPLIWRGSTFMFDQSVSTDTAFPGSTLSPGPDRSYQWWLSFRPRFALPHKFSLRVRQDMFLEWMESENTTRSRTPEFGDLWTDLVYGGLPAVADIHFGVGVRLQWPLLNYAARARGNIVTASVLAMASRSFENVLGKSFGVTLMGIAGHPFMSNTSPGLQPGLSYDCMGLSYGPDRCTAISGGMNVNWRVMSALILSWNPIERLDVSGMFILINDWLHTPPDATIHDSMGGSVTVERSRDDNRMRQSSWFLASVDFETTSWLSLSLGYYSFRPVLNPDGRYGNPFWSPGNSSRLFFTATFALDALYTAVFVGREGRGGPAAGGGSRITQNETRPRRRWSPNDAARELRQQQAQTGMFF